MGQSIQTLRRQARVAQSGGAHERAESLHRQIVDSWPDAIESWEYLSAVAARRGDFGASARALRHYLDVNDCSAYAWRSLGIAQMHEQNWREALSAFQETLRLEPEVRVNLIYLGGAAIEAGQRALAADSLSLALQGLPADEIAAQKAGTEPVLASILEEAIPFLEGYLADLVSDGRELTGNLEGACWRFHETTPPEWNDKQQRPDRFFLAGVAPQPWYEAGDLPWGQELEAAFRDIRHEVEAKLSREDASPYIAGHTLEAEHWGSLADNEDWTAIHLYSGGRPHARQVAKFPKTMAALEKLPLCRTGGQPVEVFFSLLKPGGHIVPHYGTSNARLTVHLPILVPCETGASMLRVGDEKRIVEAGKLLIFDDSFRHEACNDGSSMRINLIFEVWNPALSDREIEAVKAMHKRFDDWFMGRGRRMNFLGATLAEAVQADRLYNQAAERIKTSAEDAPVLLRQVLALNPRHKKARRHMAQLS